MPRAETVPTVLPVTPNVSDGIAEKNAAAFVHLAAFALIIVALQQRFPLFS